VAGAFAGAAAAAVLAVFLLGPLGGLAASPTWAVLGAGAVTGAVVGLLRRCQRRR
jgi:hypothetical protein